MSKHWRWQLYFVVTERNNAEKLLKIGLASYLTAHPELASSEVRLGVTCEGDWRAFALFVSNFERVEFVTLMRDMVQDANPQLTIRTTKPLKDSKLFSMEPDMIFTGSVKELLATPLAPKER